VITPCWACRTTPHAVGCVVADVQFEGVLLALGRMPGLIVISVDGEDDFAQVQGTWTMQAPDRDLPWFMA